MRIFVHDRLFRQTYANFSNIGKSLSSETCGRHQILRFNSFLILFISCHIQVWFANILGGRVWDSPGITTVLQRLLVILEGKFIGIIAMLSLLSPNPAFSRCSQLNLQDFSQVELSALDLSMQKFHITAFCALTLWRSSRTWAENVIFFFLTYNVYFQ